MSLLEQAQVHTTSQPEVPANEQSPDTVLQLSAAQFEYPDLEPMALPQRQKISPAIATSAQKNNIYSLASVEPAEARTILMAVDTFGPQIQKEFDLSPDFTNFVIQQSRAIVRHQVRASLPSGDKLRQISAKEIAEIEVDNDVRLHQPNIPKRRMAANWKDEGINDVLFTESDIADKPVLKFMALALDRMIKKTDDVADKQAAKLALGQLLADPKIEPIVTATIHPEKLRRVKLAATLGPWAGKLVARAVAKPRRPIIA